MSERDSPSDGPVLEIRWNFPLFRALSIGGQKVGTLLRNKDIPEKIQNSRPRNKSTSDTEDSEEGRMEQLRDDIQSLRDEGGELDFSQTADTDDDVTYNGEVFVPVRAHIESDGEVSWTNETEEDVTLVSTTAPASFEVEIPAGETETVDLFDEGVYQYRLQTQPASEICGAVVVGDTEDPDNLPCESDIDRVIFESDRDTLSVAADKKEREF